MERERVENETKNLLFVLLPLFVPPQLSLLDTEVSEKEKKLQALGGRKKGKKKKDRKSVHLNCRLL